MEATIPGNHETRHAYKLGLLSRPQNSIEVEISGNDYENVATIQNVSSSLTSFSDSVIDSLSSTELMSEALKFQDDPTQLLFIIDHTKIPRSAPLTQLDTCRRAIPLEMSLSFSVAFTVQTNIDGHVNAHTMVENTSMSSPHKAAHEQQ